ncbi:MAG: hypothetical protein WAW31_08065 [Smithella sp.]
MIQPEINHAASFKEKPATATAPAIRIVSRQRNHEMIDEPKVIIVILRRPNCGNLKEMRTDPFWEFGSFGCTRCHTKNLMNPRKIDLLNRVKLAFAQGGRDGFKLVLLTDPIRAISHGDFAEAKWTPENRPCKYSKAPLLIRNDGTSDFPLLRHFIASANCSSWEAKFSSKFRSRRMPLDTSIAAEIVRVFDEQVASGDPDLFISTYIDALPYPPPQIDHNRLKTYSHFLGIPLEINKA